MVQPRKKRALLKGFINFDISNHRDLKTWLVKVFDEHQPKSESKSDQKTPNLLNIYVPPDLHKFYCMCFTSLHCSVNAPELIVLKLLNIVTYRAQHPTTL